MFLLQVYIFKSQQIQNLPGNRRRRCSAFRIANNPSSQFRRNGLSCDLHFEKAPASAITSSERGLPQNECDEVRFKSKYPIWYSYGSMICSVSQESVHMIARLLVGMILGCGLVASAQDAPIFYEEEVAASNPLRTAQAKELDDYIVGLKNDESRFHTLFRPDYTSVTAYEKSAESLRKAFCDSIGYPPPGLHRKNRPSA